MLWDETDGIHSITTKIFKVRVCVEGLSGLSSLCSKTVCGKNDRDLTKGSENTHPAHSVFALPHMAEFSAGVKAMVQVELRLPYEPLQKTPPQKPPESKLNSTTTKNPIHPTKKPNQTSCTGLH